MQNNYTDYDNLLLFSFFYVCCFVMNLCEMTTNISAIVRFVYTKYPVSNTSAHGEKCLVAVTQTRVTATKRNSILWTD